MNSQIYEEASHWIVRHRDGGLDAQEKQAFDAWLRESPQQVRAYLEISSVWEDLPSLNASWNPTADELVARARADDNVMPLPAPTADRPRAAASRLREGVRRTRSKLQPMYLLAASIVLALVGAGFYLQHGVYATDIGEQRSLMLADGSTVELNARSRIRVRYAERERLIELTEGQALFNVAKNKARPFIVQTGNTRVRAVGTAFDVHKAGSGTVVTVIEGRVAVQTQQTVKSAVSGRLMGTADHTGTKSAGVLKLPEEILVTGGEQLVVTPAAVATPKRANVAAAIAWTRRNLVFESSPLTEVAEEFNRYNTRRLVIEDARLEDFYVSGMFSSVEPTLLLRFLNAQPELLVEETDTEIRIKKK